MQELIAHLVELERRFWEHVLTQTPPQPDGSTACTEMLVLKYPTSSNTAPLILPADADDWIRQYRQARAEEDAAGERKRLVENRLKEVMGEHERSCKPPVCANHWLYFSFAGKGQGGYSTFSAWSLCKWGFNRCKVLFEATPKSTAGVHFTAKP